MKHTYDELRLWQALPLSIKIRMTEERIRMWVKEYTEDGVYLSFSGGKDSTVLLDIIRNRMGLNDMPVVFIDTGLEYPELRDFVKGFENITWIKPKMNFRKVIEKYGYPFLSKELSAMIGGGQKAMEILENDCVNTTNEQIIKEECEKRFKKLKGEWRHLAQSMQFYDCKNIKVTKTYSVSDRYKQLLFDRKYILSDKCCMIMKKNPAHLYHKETGRNPITAQMASESRLRTQQWLKNGCNGFDNKIPTSNPMSFWTEEDVLLYIKENNIEICSVYGDIIEKEGKLKCSGCQRTGCTFCGYGCHIEKESRFERLKITHPKLYEYIMKDWNDGGLDYKNFIDWINEIADLNIKY